MTLAASAQSQTWTYVDGDWYEGNVAILGPRCTPCGWAPACSTARAGSRAWRPTSTCTAKRVNASAIALGLKPTMTRRRDRRPDLGRAEEIRRQDGGLYPADVLGRAWRLHGRAGRPVIDPLLPLPLRIADDRAERVSRSPCRRSAGRRIETMPTNAKAGCLYPNNGRAILEAKMRGFDNALVLDMLGNVAETGDLQHLPGQGRACVDAGRRTARSCPASRARAPFRCLADYGFQTSPRRRCRCAISWRPTRSSRPATIPRSCR